MKIVFHPDFLHEIDDTPAGKIGRLTPMVKHLKKIYPNSFILPKPADRVDLERAHSIAHIEQIKMHYSHQYPNLYYVARLAAGGAIECARQSINGNPSFGLIRPPGHHASGNSCWGFCYFCNMAIALLYLREKHKKKRAFVLDFDLHTGDGNINILRAYGQKHHKDRQDYEIINPDARSESVYLEIVQESLDNARKCDVIAVSAGFDQGLNDWGDLLSVKAYHEIGLMVKEFSEDHCNGIRFALLEGGYNSSAMALNAEGFLSGFF
ncbi:histone deacetylase family protein [Candidatus Harpocratesius sp.]